MANDPSSERADAEGAAESLADAEGLDRDLLEQLLAGNIDDDGTGPLGDVLARIEAVEASVADLDDALDDQIQDVRERVIQVKRETDSKAPGGHDHPELAADLTRLDEDLTALENHVNAVAEDVSRVDERVDDVDDRLSAGFSNYEDVLEYLLDATDDLNRKVDTLARATMRLRERTGRLEAADADRAAADALRETAQTNGVTEAKCEDCGETVRLGLLTEPNCPHCESAFARLDPSRRFFRSSVLRTGRRPALEGEVQGEGPDLDAIVEAEVEAPPAVGGGTAGADLPDGDAAPAPGTAGDDADGGVEAVPGVGPAYAERLRSADVSTIRALADADPERLADEVDVAQARVEKWVRRARETGGAG